MYPIPENSTVAVIGGGVAGIVAAHLIGKRHRVTLFEGEQKIGGHTNTITIESGPDSGLGIDTGFIVLNDRTYPNFHKFLAELGVKARYANMSFSFYCERTGFQYGSLDFNMIFAQRKNLFSPSFLKMLYDTSRFWSAARRLLAEEMPPTLTLRSFLEKNRLTGEVAEHYIIPIGAAIWSTSKSGMYDFPAETFLRFFEKHGLLGILDQPRWQTVMGASHSYLKAFQNQFKGEILSSHKVTNVTRNAGGATVTTAEGIARSFDYVVIATHADQILPLLETPSDAERRILSPWRYQQNLTYLHTDESFLPPLKRAWASWNYRREIGEEGNEPVSITYHMNTLQGIKSDTQYSVTLNPRRAIREDKIIKQIEYFHPLYTRETLLSQKELGVLQGQQRTWYCGSYFGFGFHEDAVRSSVDVGKVFGGELI